RLGVGGRLLEGLLLRRSRRAVGVGRSRRLGRLLGGARGIVDALGDVEGAVGERGGELAARAIEFGLQAWQGLGAQLVEHGLEAGDGLVLQGVELAAQAIEAPLQLREHGGVEGGLRLGDGQLGDGRASAGAGDGDEADVPGALRACEGDPATVRVGDGPDDGSLLDVLERPGGGVDLDEVQVQGARLGELAAPDGRDVEWPTLDGQTDGSGRGRAVEVDVAVRAVGLLAPPGDEVAVSVVLRDGGVRQRGVSQPRRRRQRVVHAAEADDLARDLLQARVRLHRHFLLPTVSVILSSAGVQEVERIRTHWRSLRNPISPWTKTSSPTPSDPIGALGWWMTWRVVTSRTPLRRAASRRARLLASVCRSTLSSVTTATVRTRSRKAEAVARIFSRPSPAPRNMTSVATPTSGRERSGGAMTFSPTTSR